VVRAANRRNSLPRSVFRKITEPRVQWFKSRAGWHCGRNVLPGVRNVLARGCLGLLSVDDPAEHSGNREYTCEYIRIFHSRLAESERFS
jgi:hypothetical protein